MFIIFLANNFTIFRYLQVDNFLRILKFLKNVDIHKIALRKYQQNLNI